VAQEICPERQRGTIGLVIASIGRVTEGHDGALGVDRSGEEVIGNRSVGLVERLIRVFEHLLHEVNQLLIKHVRVHGLKVAIRRSDIRLFANGIDVSKAVAFRVFHELVEGKRKQGKQQGRVSDVDMSRKDWQSFRLTSFKTVRSSSLAAWLFSSK